MGMLGCNYGYGDWGNAAEVLHMRQQDSEGKKNMLKNYGKRILRDMKSGKTFALN